MMIRCCQWLTTGRTGRSSGCINNPCSYGRSLNHFGDLFGPVAAWLILPSIVVFLLRIQKRPLHIAFLSLPLMIYLFFSVAATKMPSYPFVAAVPVFLLVAVSLDRVFDEGKKGKIPFPVLAALAGLLLTGLVWLNLWPIELYRSHSIHGTKRHYILNQRENKAFYITLRDSLPESPVLFNLPDRQYVECMFYSGFPTYGALPSKEQAEDLLHRGRTVVVLREPGRELPDYLAETEGILLIGSFR